MPLRSCEIYISRLVLCSPDAHSSAACCSVNAVNAMAKGAGLKSVSLCGCDMPTGHCRCQTSLQCQHVRGEFATALRGALCLCKLHIHCLMKRLYKQRGTEREEKYCKEKLNYFPVYCTCYDPGRRHAGK